MHACLLARGHSSPARSHGSPLLLGQPLRVTRSAPCRGLDFAEYTRSNRSWEMLAVEGEMQPPTATWAQSTDELKLLVAHHRSAEPWSRQQESSGGLGWGCPLGKFQEVTWIRGGGDVGCESTLRPLGGQTGGICGYQQGQVVSKYAASSHTIILGAQDLLWLAE